MSVARVTISPQRWAVTCDAEGCNANGPYREDRSAAEVAARDHGWEVSQDGITADLCPQHNPERTSE